MFEGVRNLTFEECSNKYISQLKTSDAVRLMLILSSTKSEMCAMQDGDDLVLLYDRVNHKPFLVIERMSMSKAGDVKEYVESATAMDTEFVFSFVEYPERGMADIMAVKKETYEILAGN